MHEHNNILLITSDQQHWCTLGVLHSEIQTPNLDRLAREGMLFHRAYCPNPTCTPTRASIITGKYPSQHGAWALGTKLMEDQPTVSEQFHRAGYCTALFGKAHFQPLKSTEEYPSLEAYPVLQDLDFWRQFKEPFYGFQHVELARNHTNEAHVGQHYVLWMEEQGFANWRDYFLEPTGKMRRQPGKRTWEIPEEYHYNAWIASRTVSLLQDCAKANEPFFIWSSFFAPHPPYLVPEPWASMYAPEDLSVPEGFEGEHDKNPPHFQLTQQEKPDFSSWQEEEGNALHGFKSHLVPREERAKNLACYYGMISMMDKYIGQILDSLDAYGLTEKTLVVFTTDHGHFLGQHGLNAKGAFLYEDMVRVPFVVRQPGTVPAGRESKAMQSLVDLAPSFLAHAGLQADRWMSGVDQSPVWRGEKEAVRDHVLVENRHQPTTIHQRCYIDGRHKLTVYYECDYGEMFDLEKDPQERNNLWDDPAMQSLKLELFRKLVDAELGKEPLPMPRIANA